MRMGDGLDLRHFFNQVDESRGERLDIVRLTAGDDIAVGHYSLIDDIGPGVAEVGADRGPARCRPVAVRFGSRATRRRML